MANTFVLIPGRTSQQGAGISEGKFGTKYQGEINVVLVAPEDMQQMSLSDGDTVCIKSATGQIDVAVKAAKLGDMPAGMLFIAYGDLSSRLMDSDTHGTGMPTSKGIDVTLERL